MRPSLRHILLTLGFLALAAGMGLVWMSPIPDSQDIKNPVRDKPSSGGRVLDLTRGDPQPADLVFDVSTPPVPSELPNSLQGTHVPGGWQQMDSEGNLVATAELRTLFEYFLSALGEESLEQLVARIQQNLASLPHPARDQARQTLASYLEYKLAVSRLEDSYGGSDYTLTFDEMELRMDEVQQLRRSYLDSATAEAFFRADEAIDEFQLQRMAISQDDELTPDEKTRRIEKAEQGLPEPMRQARQQSRRFEAYQQAQGELADDPAALHQYREAMFGIEAAEKLARVDDEQQDWQRRWSAYRIEADRVEKAGLAAPELEAEIGRLRERYFEGPEQGRAEALDSLQ